MKKLLIMLTIVVAFGLMAGSASAQVARWDFEEGSGPTASDSVNNNTGTLAGTALPTWVTTGGEPSGNAMQFHGFYDETDPENKFEITSYVDVATDTSITPNLDDLGSMTVALWIKDNQNYFDSTFFPTFVADGNYSAEGSWMLATDTSGWAPVGYGAVAFKTYHGGSMKTLRPTLTFPDDGQWHHIAATWDSATETKAVYIDGVFAGSVVQAGALVTNEVNVTIGASRDSAGVVDRNWNGQLDEVLIYDYALDAAEIAAIVPEPMTMTLLGIGSLVLLRRRRV